MPDIDIDFADREQILSMIDHRVAKLDTNKKHIQEFMSQRFLTILWTIYQQ